MITTIERLGAQGDGVSAEGEHIPLSAPGDRLRLEDGRIVEIIAHSPLRRAAPCPAFGRCGGCALQHIDEGYISEWKRELVVRALAQRGLAAEIAPTITVPAASRRRAAFSALRTAQGVILGFSARAAHEIIEIEACGVLAPALQAAAPKLRALADAALARRGGSALRLTATASEAGLDVAIEEGKAIDLALRVKLAAAAESLDLARLSWNGETVALRRPPAQLFGRALVTPPPGGFLQAAREGEAALAAAAREGVGKAKRVADLFSGSGALSFPLAETAAVTGLEGDAAAVAAAQEGARRTQGLKALAFERRDLFRRPLAPVELKGFDAVVLDPPRAGAAAQCEALAASSVARVVYVSCAPASFARDARTLVDGGYRLERVQPVDQFRFSAHVELAAVFVKS